MTATTTESLSRNELKARLANIYQVESISANFMRSVASDDSELHSTAVSNWFDNHPNVSGSTNQFWSGLYQAVLLSQQFKKDTDALRQGLIDAKCDIKSDEYKPLENIRKFTVVHSSGLRLVCTCSVLGGKTYAVMKKNIKNFSVPTHYISRYTVYYVQRMIQTIQNE